MEEVGRTCCVFCDANSSTGDERVFTRLAFLVHAKFAACARGTMYTTRGTGALVAEETIYAHVTEGRPYKVGQGMVELRLGALKAVGCVMVEGIS